MARPSAQAGGAPSAAAPPDERTQPVADTDAEVTVSLPVRRAAADAFRAGDTIGGRYRLDRLVGGSGHTRLWRAEDLVLARAVALRLLASESTAERRAFLTAAGEAGRVGDPRVCATYDVAEEAGDDGPVAYLVREWVEGRSLAQLLSEGPLPPARATSLVRQAAVALGHLHDVGTAHGRVHPGNVLVRDDGRVRLTDAAVGRAAGSPAPPALPPGAGPSTVDDLPDDEIARRQDTHDLGRTLYAALTGRWPGGPWNGLAAAPLADGRPLPPRQVRAGVTRELDAVALRVLDPGRRLVAPPLRTPQGVAAALAPLPAQETDAPLGPAPAAAASEVRRRRPWVLRGVIATALLALAAGGLAIGLAIGHVPGPQPNVPSFRPTPGTSPKSSASAPAPAPAAALLPISAVSAFDPPPGDGTENDNQVPLSHDGDTSTAWQTSTYTTARLGNLKPGVGLLVDLGSPQRVGTVDLTVTPGTDLEIRAADSAGSAISDFPVVGTAADTSATVSVPAHRTARYWVVWLTRLPAEGGGYRGSVAEIAFHR